MVVNHFYGQMKESEKNFFLRESIFLFRFFVLIFRREFTNSSPQDLLKLVQTNPHLCSLSKKLLFGFISVNNFISFISEFFFDFFHPFLRFLSMLLP